MVFTFLSLSHPHLALSAEMSWGSFGIEEVVVVVVWLGRAGCSLIDAELFGLVCSGGDGMTGQEKQTELRCEVILGASQRLMRTQGDWFKGCKTDRKGSRKQSKKKKKSQDQKGGRRMKDGRERGLMC